MVHAVWERASLRWTISICLLVAVFGFLAYCVVDQTNLVGRDRLADALADNAQEEQLPSDQSEEEDSNRSTRQPPSPVAPPAVSGPSAVNPQPSIPESGSRVREALDFSHGSGNQHGHPPH